MITRELEIHASSEQEAVEMAVGCLRTYYGLKGSFPLRVLVLLIMQSVDGEVVISSRREYMQTLRCNRQHLSNTLSRLCRSGLITKVKENHYLLSPVIMLKPGTGEGIRLNVKIDIRHD